MADCGGKEKMSNQWNGVTRLTSGCRADWAMIARCAAITGNGGSAGKGCPVRAVEPDASLHDWGSCRFPDRWRGRPDDAG